MCCGLLGLVHPRLSPPEPRDADVRARVPDCEGRGASESPRVHGARAEEANLHQHLQEAESHLAHQHAEEQDHRRGKAPLDTSSWCDGSSDRSFM